MNWRSDPPNVWTALYRLAVLVLLILLHVSHVLAGNLPNPLDVLNQIVGEIEPVGS